MQKSNSLILLFTFLSVTESMQAREDINMTIFESQKEIIMKNETTKDVLFFTTGDGCKSLIELTEIFQSQFWFCPILLLLT
jgi:hypothetical protein